MLAKRMGQIKQGTLGVVVYTSSLYILSPKEGKYIVSQETCGVLFKEYWVEKLIKNMSKVWTKRKFVQ